MPRGVVSTQAPAEGSLEHVQSVLAEVNRKTPAVETGFRVAREAFINAARELNQHRRRFDARLERVTAAGGTSTFESPIEVVLPTADECEPQE